KGRTSLVLTVEEDSIGLQIRSAGNERGEIVRLLGLDIQPLGPSVGSVFVSPDGKTVATSTEDGVVRLWDAMTGKRGIALEGRALGFSPDGKSLVLVGPARTLTVWDLATGKGQAIRHRVPDGATIVLSPDGKTLASFTRDSLVMLWAVDLAKKSIAPRGEVSGGNFAAFSPDGKVIAAGRTYVGRGDVVLL